MRRQSSRQGSQQPPGGSASELALAALPVAILIWQPSARGLAYANRAACNLFGVDHDTLVNTAVTELLGSKQAERLELAYGDIQRGHQSVTLDAISLATPAGQRQVNLHVSAMEEGPGQRVVLMLIGNREGTSEIRIRQNDKMEAIGRMAGGLAHDFNNLLSVVLSCSQLLMAELPEDSPLRRDCEAIHKAGMQAADLTEQLLTVGRQNMLEPQSVELNQLIRDMQPVIGKLVHPNQWVAFEPADRVAMCRINSTHIEQVIMNLVVNARDAMPKGGKIVLRTRTVSIASHDYLAGGDYVILEIEDTGVGMSPEIRERIFDPFFTTKAGSGSRGIGLGLSTVLGIVQQSRGAIDVESRPGAGTCVRVTLPADQPIEHAPSVAQRPSVTRKGTVLLVDDADEVRDVAARILEADGYQVISAARPSEALRLIQKHTDQIDLLLTDVVMPEMHGPDLARQARSQLPNVRVVLMSGYVDNLVDPKQLEEFDATFVHKPLTPKSLLDSIRKALDR